MPTTSPTQRN